MAGENFRKALIVGAGAGLSAALARAFAREGLAVALAARTPDDLAALAGATGAEIFACDASRRADVERLFSELDAKGEADEVEKSLRVSALGGFYVAQAATRRMLPQGRGAILFTGASASVKGYAQSAPFAMGKFALRGLAQSMARELAPQGIHVAHVVIDGGIRSARVAGPADRPDSLLDPDAIARTYLHLLSQPRSAWSWEIEVRPWVESFGARSHMLC